MLCNMRRGLGACVSSVWTNVSELSGFLCAQRSFLWSPNNLINLLDVCQSFWLVHADTSHECSTIRCVFCVSSALAGCRWVMICHDVEAAARPAIGQVLLQMQKVDDAPGKSRFQWVPWGWPADAWRSWRSQVSGGSSTNFYDTYW